MKEKPVFSPDIAGALIDKGFPIKRQRRDCKNPAKWIYFFDATPEFLQAFGEVANSYSIEKFKTRR